MKKRILSSILILALFASSSACSVSEQQEVIKIEKMEAEQSVGASFDILGGKDVMPIAGYYGPFTESFSSNGQSIPDYVTDEYFQMIADSGVNLIVSSMEDYKNNPSTIRNILDLGEKYDIGIFVRDSYITDNRGENTLSLEDINLRLSEYRNHKAFCGLTVVDEPGSEVYYQQGGNGGMMEEYPQLSKILTQDCDIFCYENLIKITSMSQKEAYEEYVKQFCETLSPTNISYDFYPWDEGDTRGDFTRYFWNLALIREYAQKYEIPFWVFIQAGSQWSDGAQAFDSGEYVPTEGEFDWSVNMSLAFGAQGIQYFPLIQPYYFAYAESQEFDFERNGMIGAWGNKNRWYYYAQDINKHIAAIDEVLMNSVSKGIIVSGQKAQEYCADTREAVLDGTSWRELADVSGNTIVGCFNYQGKTALYVVNNDYEWAQDITLNFQDTYKVRVLQAADTKYLATNQLTLNMEAGEGVLVVFE